MRSRARILVLGLVSGLLAACGAGGSDKAGGLPERVVLRVAAYSDDYGAKLFTDRARALSKGRIRFQFVPGHGQPPGEADHDLRVAQQVSAGLYDIAVVSAGTWDELGVTSLEPLQAPLLITDQTLFKAILASPLQQRMLAGLRAQHVVGLGLEMGLLTHPLGYQLPLIAPADFRGKGIRVPMSRINDAVVAALGARPLHVDFDDSEKMVARHELDGEELPFFAPEHAWITANVPLFAAASTIVANGDRYARLSDSQRRILQEAAKAAGRGAIHTMTVWVSEPKLTIQYCKGGHVVRATRQQLAALEQAMRPVYDQLESDATVRSIITAIEEMKRRTPPEAVPALPAGCSQPDRPLWGRERDPSFLDGTYRWRITRAGARKVGASTDDSTIGTIAGMTLKHGRFLDFANERGRFKVIGDKLAFNFGFGYTEIFRFKRRTDGTLDLTAVPPMEVGGRLVFSSSPWTRVGPPVRNP